MATVKPKQVQQSDILHLESEMNTLWGELNTSNIPHTLRMQMEAALSECEENFKAVLGGQASYDQLQDTLNTCDMQLALAVITQAENEIPKSQQESSNFQALENIYRELSEGRIKPSKARHEVKEIMRHHS